MIFLAGTSAALLPISLSNFKAIRSFKQLISRLRDFTGFYDKTSWILKQGNGFLQYIPGNMQPWWRHQMETFSALLYIWAGNSPVTGKLYEQMPVTRSFVVSLICAWINDWVNNREAGDLRRHRAHYDVTIMTYVFCRGSVPTNITYIVQGYFTGFGAILQ